MDLFALCDGVIVVGTGPQLLGLDDLHVSQVGDEHCKEQGKDRNKGGQSLAEGDAAQHTRLGCEHAIAASHMCAM